jgi:hypothetical protein
MSDTAFPNNGGWSYRQPQTGWVNPAAMIGKSASVDAIRKHRLANPAICAKHQLSTDPVAIERELIQFQQARGALPPDPSASFPQARSSLPVRVQGAVAGIKRAAQGTAVWMDWLRHGGVPVERTLGEARAVTCVACPKNIDSPWYIMAGAELLKSAIEEWKKVTGKEFNFETEQGEKLKSCDVCKCLSKIKVFVPLEYIVNNTKPEIMAEFPPNCWVQCESASAIPASATAP